MSKIPALFSECKMVKLKGGLTDFIQCSVTADGKRIDGNLYLSSVQGSGESNIQIDRTFGGDMLVTAFGEKLTPLTLTGLYIASMCPDSGANENLMKLYARYRAGTNAKTPVVVVTYGDNVFRGLLAALTLAPYSGSGGINGYSYSLKVIGSFT